MDRHGSGAWLMSVLVPLIDLGSGGSDATK